MSECIFTYEGEKNEKMAPVLRIKRGLGFDVQQAQAEKCVVDLGKRWLKKGRSNLGGVAYKRGRNVCTL